MGTKPRQRLAGLRRMHRAGVCGVERCCRLICQPAHAPQALLGGLLHGIEQRRNLGSAVRSPMLQRLAKFMAQTCRFWLVRVGKIENSFQVK